MKTIIEKCDIHITTIKNALPQEKPVAGKFQISDDCTAAVFKEEPDAVVIIGEAKGKRIMRGKNFSVWWRPEEDRYKICVFVNNNAKSAILAESDLEECLNFIKGRIINS